MGKDSPLTATGLSGRSDFLVEDEVMIRMMVADMLEELGYKVAAEAGDITEAMRLAQSTDFDLAILEELQVNNHTSLQEIGKSVNLSAAAVQRRVRRMEDARVIQSNVAIVDPASVGRPITIVVEVQIDSEQADLMDSARREFAAAPEVQQCYYVTGAADFILVLTVSTMEEYEQLSRRLFLENRNVKHFNTFVAMNRVKTSLRVPLIPGKGL